jgi:hypothetical protein
MKIHYHKFGANPFSPLVQVPVETDGSSDPGPAFKICWEDQQQGLSVVVQERENGRLIADAFSSDPAMVDSAAVSVALVGTTPDQIICKVVPFKVLQKNGCSGSADLGPLAGAVKELGPQIGLVVFLLV